jgi:uncharacterized membrane protein YkoI
MIKKSTRVLVLLVIVLTVITVVLVALAAAGIPAGNDSKQNKELQLSNNNSNNTTNSTNTSKLSKGGVEIKITPAEAQKIAETYVKEPGAKVGIPQLDEINGQLVYTVPIQINGTNVGEITINALNGANMGGAGGAP